MRTDVKVGIALGAIVLIVAGSYYGSSSEPDIELGEPSASIQKSNAQTLRELLEPRGKPEDSFPKHDRRSESQPGPVVRPPHDSNKPQEQTQRTSADSAEATAAATSLLERVLQQSKQLPVHQARKGTVSPWRAKMRDERSVAADESESAEPTLPARPGARNEIRRPRGRGVASHSGSPPQRSQSLPSPPRKPKPKTGTHVIQPGDNFSALAERYYGSQRYTEFLVNSNPAVDPRRMKVGSIVTIPPLIEGQPSGARRTAKHEYEVREGDSLYAIAQVQLGAGDRWTEIYQLNRGAIGASPSSLDVGLILRLPQP